jgi:hypothetical protein
MTKAQQVFEAMMMARNQTNLEKVKGRYVDTNVQTRWNYFFLGWQLRGVL